MLDIVLGDIRCLQRTILLTRIFQRAELEMEDPVFADAHDQIMESLAGLASAAMRKEDDRYLGIPEGLTGIGLVILSGLDTKGCNWDECLLIS